MAKLSDNKYVFTLLTALIKREGGELRLPEGDLISVTKEDVVTLLYDKNTEEIVLRVADSKKLFTMKPPNDDYEN